MFLFAGAKNTCLMLPILFQPISLLNFAQKTLYDLELQAVEFELFLDCICAFPHEGCKIKLPRSLGKAPSNVLKQVLIFKFWQISKGDFKVQPLGY